MIDTGRAVVIFPGGDPPHPRAAAHVPPGATVVAADSGLHHALAAGVRVDLVVGDLDSVEPAVLAVAERDGVAVERHPCEKDHTDLELALLTARRLGATEVLMVGGGGGRFDHLLANVLVLAHPDAAAMDVSALIGPARVAVVRRATALEGRPGGLVTLLPVGGPALGVHTSGLRYPLHGEDLAAASSRGVSNELLGDCACVQLSGGTLLAIQPNALDEEA